MKGFPLSFALIIGLLTSASTAMAQTVNMNSYITLTVGSGESIKLNFLAAAVGTPVRIVSGSNTQDITVGTNWTGTSTYTAGSTTMTIYGDLTGFDCSYNAANLTALDPSHNTQLKWLNCSYNQISGLDVSKNTQLISLDCSNNNLTTLDLSHNTQLTKLYCFSNNLSSLDVRNNTQLEGLGCSRNKLTALDVSNNTQLEVLECLSNQLATLDVSQNTQLTRLECSYNKLTALDVSNNTQLKELYCYNNNLTTLDVSGCTQLTRLYCYGNNFTTAALDNIYCALPDRTSKYSGAIQPVSNSSSSYNDTVLATNKTNTTAKNWKVRYYSNNTDIPATTGIYVCGTPHPEPNMSRYITLTVKKDSAIKLDFKAAADDTPIRIVSGSTDTTVTVGTSLYGSAYLYSLWYGDESLRRPYRLLLQR